MCNTLLSCPLCSTPRFDDLETLRVALIKVATENLSCPICGEVYMGLDKLTIHLFSHQECDLKNNRTDLNLKTEDENVTSECETIPSPAPDVNSNENSLSAEVREYKKRRNKKKKTANNIIKKDLVEHGDNNNSTNKCLPVFNMNTIVPFIGIPQNMSTDVKPHKYSEKRGNKSNKLSEKCDICGFFFLGKNILEMHKKLIHNIHNSEIVNGVSHYCCHLCSKVFKMKGSLMVHLRMVHFAVIPSVSEDSVERNDEAKSPNSMEVCNDDSKQATQSDANAGDKPSDSGGECNSSGKTWKCDICEKNFTTKYFLKKHKRLHTGEMPYSCTQCNKTFTFQQSYHKHLLYHNDEKPHTCSHCGRGFKELSTLHNHQRIHTGEKPFECETCGKCFRQRVSYLVHRRIHTGAMPYKCTACDKSFRYKVSQRMHKCTAQPPGTVVRQSGDLVQKLMKNHQDTTNDILNEFSLSGDESSNNNSNLGFGSNKQDDAIAHDEILVNICEQTFTDVHFNDKSNSADDKNVNCIIDEIVKESISKIDFGEPKPSTSTDFHGVRELYSIVSNQSNENIKNLMDESLPSPSDGIKNLKLSSMSPEMVIEHNDMIKAFDKNEMSFMFEIAPSESTNNFIKNKDNNMHFLQDNLECQNIFTNR